MSSDPLKDRAWRKELGASKQKDLEPRFHIATPHPQGRQTIGDPWLLMYLHVDQDWL